LTASGVLGEGADASSVVDGYRRRWRHHEESRARAAERSRRLSSIRGATFLAGVGALIGVEFFEGGAENLALAVLAAVVVTFVWLVAVHRRVRREERWSEALGLVAREGILRGERRWAELEEALPLEERSMPEVPREHPYAQDLDVVGRASLWRLLGPLTSRGARQKLRAWLLEPATPGGARARQEAVRELAPLVELRSELAALGRRELRDASGEWGRFLMWIDQVAPQRGKSWDVAGFALPLALLGTVVADVALGAGPWWLLVAIPQLWAARHVTRSALPAFEAVASAAAPARAAVPQMRLLDETTWEGERLRSVRAALGHGKDAAHRRLGALLRFVDTVESRRNIVYASLGPLLLLDFHLLRALERWRDRHGHAVRDWLDASFEWEGLAGLATLAHDHPEWSYPELAPPGAGRVDARALGHPLLPPETCVRNDVSLGPAGTFLLVTGSNMSGKSTLLRSLGLNVALAGAGAPVCAEQLVTPCMRVFTCMRIDDSLEEGVSLFMAELLRIRAVVDAARDRDPEARPVLYLLDEMLHGTNTAERRVAARGVLRHLLDAGALGAVSTHDLGLAEVAGLREAAVPVYFREHVERDGADGRPRISFDYRMRPGIATTRNALKLLEAVGLSVPEGLGAEEAAVQGKTPKRSDPSTGSGRPTEDSR
jgi:hypothetical protein